VPFRSQPDSAGVVIRGIAQSFVTQSVKTDLFLFLSQEKWKIPRSVFLLAVLSGGHMMELASSQIPVAAEDLQ